MKLVKPLIALVMVIILGFGAYFFIYNPDLERRIREAQEQFLVRFDPNTIVSFTIGRPDSSMVIEKGMTRNWNILEPVSAEAENEEIYRFFNHLRNTQIQFIVEEHPRDLSNFGLENAPFYLAMKYQDGTADTLFSGMFTPDESMNYVKFASEDRVLTVDRAMFDFLKQPVRAYCSRTLLNIAEMDITGIELIRGTDETITLSKNGTIWMMAQPWEYQASPTNIKELINTIVITRKDHFVTEHTDDLAQYGLDNPQFVLRISLQPGIPDKILLIGDAMMSGDNKLLYHYAKQFDRDLIFTVAQSSLNDFRRIPIWYVDQFPMKFNQERVNRIIIETPGNTLTIIRGSQGYWSMISPVDINLEETVVSEIFSISRFLVFHDVFAYEPTPDDVTNTGLDDPQIKLTFYQNDNMFDYIEFGGSFTDEELNTFCRTSTRPIIYITRAPVNERINSILKTAFEQI
ncbi:DUF4340 domain-containing protein [Candidatus Latescibacterota bacterium]